MSINLLEDQQDNKNFGYYFAEFMYESYAKAAGVQDNEFSKVLDAILAIINKIREIDNNRDISIESKAFFFKGILDYFNGEHEVKGFKFRSSVRQFLRTEWGTKITAIKNTINQDFQSNKSFGIKVGQ